MPTLRAVRHVTPAEIPALHDTFEAAAFGEADRVDVIALRKKVRADDVAGLHFFGEVTKFFDALERAAAEFLEVPEQRLRHALFFLVLEGKLHGFVAVGLDSLGLKDAV